MSEPRPDADFEEMRDSGYVEARPPVFRRPMSAPTQGSTRRKHMAELGVPGDVLALDQRLEQAEADLAELLWLVERANPSWSGYAEEWWRRQRAFLAQWGEERTDG